MKKMSHGAPPAGCHIFRESDDRSSCLLCQAAYALAYEL